MTDTFSPLNDDELEWLNDFLLERIDEEAVTKGQDEGILDVSELDGLLTAVVSGPVVIPPSQWLPQVWGDFEPVFEDAQEMQTLMSLLVRHMNSIAQMLMEQPADFEPMFLERMVEGRTFTIVDEWCEGYMRGVTLAAEQWDLQDLQMKILLAPILAFQGDKAQDTHANFSEEELRNLQDAIAPNVHEIHAYWLARRTDLPSAAPLRREAPKVGRNDPCPCGSGKKYKKCCLH